MQSIKIMLIILLFIGFFIALLWFTITQPFVVTASKTIDIQVSAEQLKKHVQMLSSKLPPRSLDTDQLDISANYIRQHFAKVGQPYDMEYQVAGIPYRNIAIQFGSKTKERIVIGAHYDAFDGLPGADDNASAVAALIELSKLLSNTQLNCTVELIAYTLEEPPHFRTEDMGSAVHARHLQEQQTEILLMLSLEMIGYFSDEINSQEYPAGVLNYVYPNKGNFIAVVSNFSGINITRRIKGLFKGNSTVSVHSINAPPIIPGIDFSDHRNFWAYNYPAVMITDTAFYRNKAYHSQFDTWDRLDYQRMAEVVKGVFAVVLDFANQNHQS